MDTTMISILVIAACIFIAGITDMVQAALAKKKQRKH